MLWISLFALSSCTYDVERAEKDIVTAHSTDMPEKLDYSFRHLDSTHFYTLINTLILKYDNDIYLLSDIAIFLHQKSIYNFDSQLIDRCYYFQSLPNNFTWRVYYKGDAVREYSTGDKNNAYKDIPNTICNIFQ